MGRDSIILSERALVPGRDGRPVVAYFSDEAAAGALLTEEAACAAIGAIGAFADLDWDEAVAEFEGIRHASPPTPPISL